MNTEERWGELVTRLTWFKDVRAQNVPTYRFFLNLPHGKVMIYFCQKGKKKGVTVLVFKIMRYILEDCVTLTRS